MATGDDDALAGTRVGILGKGGAGKSTALILLARELRRRGLDVCVLDVDSTNVGLHNGLGISRQPESLLDLFGGMIFSGGLVTCPVDDPTPLPGADIDLLELPKAYVARNDEGIFLVTAGKIGGLGPGAGCDGPIAKLARDIRIRVGEHRPIVLLDFKAGVEDFARGAVTSLDWIIVVVDPTHAAVQMAADVRLMIERIQAGELPATHHLERPELVELANRIFEQTAVRDVFVLMNRVSDSDVEMYLRDGLRLRGIQPAGVIREDPALALAWLKGEVLPAVCLEGAEEVLAILRGASVRAATS